MRKSLGLALASLLFAGSANGAALDFTGTLSLRLLQYPAFAVPGAGTAQVSTSGGAHLASFLLSGGTFGPVTTILPTTTDATVWSIRLTLTSNRAGTFTGISGGPSGGGPMGLQGVAKMCTLDHPNCLGGVFVPLTPTTGGNGFGIGGTVTVPGPVALTMQNVPWTVGQPTITIHTPISGTTTPAVPGGFAHGPASLTSSTAQPSAAIQLVTVTKVYTSLVGAWPEMPVTGVLTLHFVPEPGTLLLLGSGVAGLAILGRKKKE